MKKLAVIHNLPIDYYPPAFNLVKVAVENGVDVTVVTTCPQIGFKVDMNKKVKVITPIKERRGGNSVIYLLKQIYFVLYALSVLIRLRPDVILYYETSSALAPYLYHKLCNRKTKICAHYHEYTPLNDFKLPGMRFQRLAQLIEKRCLLKCCSWISHTNKYRMSFFKSDYPFLNNTQCHILPNYPPKSWKTDVKQHSGNVTRCVLIGSLSIKDTFLEEFCQWVIAQNGNVTVDFYSFNFHPEIIDFFSRVDSLLFTLHPNGIPYQSIPEVLSQYDIGLLLYKAANLNYKYNETNKFYEYLICGLDVWYPHTMTLLNEIASSKFAQRTQSFNVETGEYPHVENAERTVDNQDYNLFCEKLYVNFMHDINLI